MNIDTFFNNIDSIFDKNDIKVDVVSKEKYRNDWSTDFKSNPVAIVFPKTSEQVLEVIKLCNEADHPIIGSGGRTGLSGGASAISNELIVSFEKMNKILDFDIKSKTVLCEPGVITENLQSFADNNNLYYPVDFSSAGSSQIGGNIATNAGGIRVIKYGTTANYVVGMEVVSGSGKLISMDTELIKNATGPDLKNSFIGSEGIFGLTTSCRLKLINKTKDTEVILIGFDDLFSLDEIMNSIFKFDIEAIEFFTRNSINQVSKVFKSVNTSHLNNNYYLLIESQNDISLKHFLEKIYKKDLVQEILISSNNSQKESIWQYRLLMSESVVSYAPLKFDIAVPVMNIVNLINKLEEFIKENNSYHLILFGHLGDGNLHINILSKEKERNESFIEKNIYEIVLSLNGTISAEHGIGVKKLEKYMQFGYKENISLIKNLKNYFDPNSILNPGKLVK